MLFRAAYIAETICIEFNKQKITRIAIKRFREINHSILSTFLSISRSSTLMLSRYILEEMMNLTVNTSFINFRNVGQYTILILAFLSFTNIIS